MQHYWIGRFEPAIWAESEEWRKMLPGNVRIAVFSGGVSRLVPDYLREARERIKAAVQRLQDDVGADVINVGGSPVVALGGYRAFLDFEQELLAMARVPLITSLRADFQAMKALGIRKLAIASPYPVARTRERVELLKEAGYTVVHVQSMDIERNAEIARVEPATALAFLRAVSREAAGADGLFITCGSFLINDLIAPLEEEFGRPVLTTAQTQVWAALEHLPVPKPITDRYGQLFRCRWPA